MLSRLRGLLCGCAGHRYSSCVALGVVVDRDLLVAHGASEGLSFGKDVGVHGDLRHTTANQDQDQAS